MTPRERVLAILHGEQPDQVPWFGDLDYWASALIGRNQKPSNFKQSYEYINWHRHLRVGFYLQGYFPFKTIIENCKVTQWQDGNNKFRKIETPRGNLQECWTYIPESFTEAPTEHLVKSEADLAAYAYMHENTRYEPDYEFAYKRLEQIGNMGVLLCYLPKSPFMQMVALDAGIMNVTMMYMNDRLMFESALATVKKSHDRAAEIAVSSPAEVLMIPENLSSEVVGPNFFDLYMKNYHVYWAYRIKTASKYSYVHLDGTLKGLLKQQCQTGISVIEAMTPAPVGDVPVGEWGNYANGSNSILWGGIPGIYFTDLVSDEEFDRHTIEVINVMKQRPRYVLGVADQVPPDGLERRVMRVSELVDQYGKY
jgi:uroporphyrinogen-III decarboxylase